MLHISINNLINQNEANISAAIMLFTTWQIRFDCHIIGDNLPVLTFKNIMKPPWESSLSKLFKMNHYMWLINIHQNFASEGMLK